MLPVLSSLELSYKDHLKQNSPSSSCYSLPCAAPVAPNPTQCGGPRYSYPDLKPTPDLKLLKGL